MMSWLEQLFNPPFSDAEKRAKERTENRMIGQTSLLKPLVNKLKSASKKTAPVISQEKISLTTGAIAYALVRKPRRNVGIRIDADGLTVNAAIGTPMLMIESFIRQHESWVLKKLEVWQARAVEPMLWQPQTELLFHGSTITLHWDQTRSSPVQFDLPSVKIGEPRQERIAARVTQWLKREALLDFSERTMHMCRLHGIAPPRVLLSSAKHRWGSCNSKREVRLNWRLIQAAPALIDYVICHELAHLKHMNHSARFWAEVARMCPDYDRLRKQLQDLDHQLKRF